MPSSRRSVGHEARRAEPRARVPSLHVSVRRNGTATVLRLSGALDVYTVSTFRKAIGVGDLDSRHMIVDLNEVTLLDSSGVAALLTLRNRIEDAGRRLGIVHTRPDLESAFAISGLTTGVVFGGTQDGVRAALGPSRHRGGAHPEPVGRAADPAPPTILVTRPPDTALDLAAGTARHHASDGRVVA